MSSGLLVLTCHVFSVKAGGMRIKGARVHEEKLTKEETESPWEGEHAKEYDQFVLLCAITVVL